MSNVAFQLRERQEHIQERINKQTKTSTVIVEKGKISKGEVFLLVALAVVFFAISILVVNNYATIHTLNREVHMLQSEIENKERVNDDLQLQVTELSEPDRIMKIAKEKLGLTLNENNVKVIGN